MKWEFDCSGCVTSAETILIQQQSTETFLQALKKVMLYKLVHLDRENIKCILLLFQYIQLYL